MNFSIFVVLIGKDMHIIIGHKILSSQKKGTLKISRSYVHVVARFAKETRLIPKRYNLLSMISDAHVW